MTEDRSSLDSVVIGVCTYQRVSQLGVLLAELQRQILACSDWNVRIIVADNDEKMTAKSAVEKASKDFPRVRIEYNCVPEKGVGFARNAIFDSLKSDELLIFFDDDQEPCPTWLAALLNRHLSVPDEVLVGPVIPVLPDSVPQWAVEAAAWGRREQPDGSIRSHAGFGNILIPRSTLESGLCRVPEPFLRGPGEDTYITVALRSAGYVIRYVDAARAVEPVANERLNIPWLRQRATVSAETWVQVVRFTGGSKVRLVASAIKTLFGFCILKMQRNISRDQALLMKLEVSAGRLVGYWRGFGSWLHS
ncbi:glycosyltransferase family 2 protein [Pseudarthrobacter enclensis]|uniref:Glycosyltransferase involved in cell wall biosynthesis n=1 Tax=Pseudarthrobacter enclensis TaxID=993070 RepID=A0ABT9RX50_9MICC|nr:glycosyltransferase family A protein [Pseudarthrobacter enclensis]MDP9889817.1 glycosyltransferase involved in cell wall biosynthesis [Pseudarthrobacter enclensis]